jgi:hypothetical protein
MPCRTQPSMICGSVSASHRGGIERGRRFVHRLQPAHRPARSRRTSGRAQLACGTSQWAGPRFHAGKEPCPPAKWASWPT